jgi:hypothetical protein
LDTRPSATMDLAMAYLSPGASGHDIIKTMFTDYLEKSTHEWLDEIGVSKEEFISAIVLLANDIVTSGNLNKWIGPRGWEEMA